MYEYGKGVAQNDDEALKWYRKATEQTDRDAELRLVALEKHNVNTKQ